MNVVSYIQLCYYSVENWILTQCTPISLERTTAMEGGFPIIFLPLFLDEPDTCMKSPVGQFSGGVLEAHTVLICMDN